MKAPPLLVSFDSLDSYLASLEPELREAYGQEITSLYEAGLPPVVSTRCLAALFGYSTKFVNAMVSQSWKYYRHFSIRRGKKKRAIDAPRVSIKVVHKWLATHLSSVLEFDGHVYGYVQGRSSFDAAAQHSNARWVYSVDIQNFFPSTTEEVVRDSLATIGYSEKACDILSKLTCLKGRMPQGAPSSPLLSNLAMRGVDLQLRQLATDHQVRLSRYADDIVFSGTGDFPETLKQQVAQVFVPTCWKLSGSKEYYAELPNRLKIHGLLVHNDAPRLTKGYRNKLRAYKHMLDTGKVQESDIARIKGHLKYADFVTDRRGGNQ